MSDQVDVWYHIPASQLANNTIYHKFLAYKMVIEAPPPNRSALLLCQLK